ncbi:MAG TPA: DUF72 domain-containing protein [Candidatus Limnocylindrales bacterium]|nr:DUF72 domain-containing protein [Candidatus Limnocylindrales bacterium]
MPPENLSPLLHLGTSSFTAEGWEKAFYPKGVAARDFLSYYATQFDTVEVDSTFYRIPAISTVKGWNAKTPAHFLFALKTPQEITHERVLVDTDRVLNEFLRAAEPLGEKLAAILLQFPYFNKKAFASPADFLARLKPFLEKLPARPRFAVEVRNKYWLAPPLFDLLRKHKIALTLVDHPWMPRPREFLVKADPITTDFTYIRWLGDRKAIEQLTNSWDKTIIDRTKDLQEWVEACRNFLKRKIRVFAFANNHYGGHAPATLRLFENLMLQK